MVNTISWEELQLQCMCFCISNLREIWRYQDLVNSCNCLLCIDFCQVFLPENVQKIKCSGSLLWYLCLGCSIVSVAKCLLRCLSFFPSSMVTATAL